MKTDSQLQKDVMDEIKWEPSTTAAKIGVSVANGVVTLNGVVATYAEKWAVERAVQRVEGVKGVAEEITIKPFGDHVKTDAEIAEATVSALKWHVWVPNNIQADVAQGWVTLRGQVNWDYQRSAAEDSVSFMPGVKGVSNEITLKSIVRPSGVKDAIEKALVRNARIDAECVNVAANGGAVTLSGSVRSRSEKDQAYSAAWNAPALVVFLTISKSRATFNSPVLRPSFHF
jgi:osmotically-inducible protein OsmY